MKEYQENETMEMAEALAAGQVLAFPTDTVYGVGTIYGNKDALNRLKQIKHRPETKPVPMMCADLTVMEPIVHLSRMAQTIADAFLPGALTLIVELKEDSDRFYTNGKETAAVRIPDSPVLLEVMSHLDRPLMVTSANVSGEPAALNKEDAAAMLPDLDGILGGSCRALQASTIVDCTGSEPKILREGPISLEQIQAVLSEAD